MADRNKTQAAGRWIDGAGIDDDQDQSEMSCATEVRAPKASTLEGGAKVRDIAGGELAKEGVKSKEGRQHKQGNYASSSNLE